MQAAVLPTRRPNSDFGGLSYQPTNGNPATFSTTPIPNPGASATIPTVPVPSILRDQARKNTDPTIHQTCVVPVATKGSKDRVKDLYKPGTFAFSEQPYFASFDSTIDPDSFVSTKAFHRNGQNGYDKVSNLTSLGFLMECKTVADRRAEYTFNGGAIKLNSIKFPGVIGGSTDNDPVQWITARTSHHMSVNHGDPNEDRYVCLFNNNPELVNNRDRDAVAANYAIGGSADQRRVVELFATNTLTGTPANNLGSTHSLSPFLVPIDYVDLQNLVTLAPRRPIGAVDGEFALDMVGNAANKQNFIRDRFCRDFVQDEEKEGIEYHRLFQGLDASASTFPFGASAAGLRIDSTTLNQGNFDSVFNNRSYASVDNRNDDVRLRALYESVYFGVQERKEYNNTAGMSRANTCYNRKAVGLLSDYCLGPWSPKGVVVYKYSTMGSNEQEEHILDASQHALFELAVEGVGMMTEYAYDEKRDNKQRGMQGRMSLDSLNQKRRLRTSVGDDFYLLVVGTVQTQVLKQDVADFGRGPDGTGRPVAHSIRFIKSTSEELSKAATPLYNPYVLAIQKIFSLSSPGDGKKAYEKTKSLVFGSNGGPTLHFGPMAAPTGGPAGAGFVDVTAKVIPSFKQQLEDALKIPQPIIDAVVTAGLAADGDVIELGGEYPDVLLVKNGAGTNELFILNNAATPSGNTLAEPTAPRPPPGDADREQYDRHMALIQVCKAAIDTYSYTISLFTVDMTTAARFKNDGTSLSFIKFTDMGGTDRFMGFKGLTAAGATDLLSDFTVKEEMPHYFVMAHEKAPEWEEKTNSNNLRMNMAGLKEDELVLGGWKIGTVMDTAATRPMPSFANSPSLDPSTFGVTINIDIQWVSSIDLHDKFWTPTGSR